MTINIDEVMTIVKGNVWKIAGRAAEGEFLLEGLVLELVEKDVTFEDSTFKKHEECMRLMSRPLSSVDYYFILDIHDNSECEPLTIGVFIPTGIEEETVTQELKERWGPATELRR